MFLGGGEEEGLALRSLLEFGELAILQVQKNLATATTLFLPSEKCKRYNYFQLVILYITTQVVRQPSIQKEEVDIFYRQGV